MKIKGVTVINEGYVHCSSNFYSAHDILNNLKFSFSVGINKITGEIDSGIWAISYLLSMYRYKPENFVLFQQPTVLVNDENMSLDELAEFSCYMDTSYPLFSDNVSVRELVSNGLKYSKIKYTVDDIKSLFSLSDKRFESSLSTVGNEIFRAMSAVAFAYDKQIFCFPWLSKMRFDKYHQNLTILLQMLEKFNKTVILPIGISI